MIKRAVTRIWLEGALKSADKAYNDEYKKVCSIDIPEMNEIFSENLVETQTPEKLDDVAGATASLKQFKVLSEAAINASKENNKSTVIVQL